MSNGVLGTQPSQLEQLRSILFKEGARNFVNNHILILKAKFVPIKIMLIKTCS